jgi:hypothetical protein
LRLKFLGECYQTSIHFRSVVLLFYGLLCHSRRHRQGLLSGIQDTLGCSRKRCWLWYFWLYRCFGFCRGYDKYYDASKTFRTEETGTFGVAMGLNLEVVHRFSIGLGVEGATPNIVAKAGYKF